MLVWLLFAVNTEVPETAWLGLEEELGCARVCVHMHICVYVGSACKGV